MDLKAKVIKDNSQLVIASSTGTQSQKAVLLSSNEEISVQVPSDMSFENGELIWVEREVHRLRGKDRQHLREIVIYKFVAKIKADGT